MQMIVLIISLARTKTRVVMLYMIAPSAAEINENASKKIPFPHFSAFAEVLRTRPLRTLSALGWLNLKLVG